MPHGLHSIAALRALASAWSRLGGDGNGAVSPVHSYSYSNRITRYILHQRNLLLVVLPSAGVLSWSRLTAKEEGEVRTTAWLVVTQHV